MFTITLLAKQIKCNLASGGKAPQLNVAERFIDQFTVLSC